VRRIRELFRPYYIRWVYFQFLPRARPAEFSACWQFRSFPLKDPEMSAQIRIGDQAPFIFYPMADLHARVQRTYQLAKALADSGHTCFFVNPHLGRQFPKPHFQSPVSRFGLIAPNLVELHLRLPREPVYHSRLLNASEISCLSDAISTLRRLTGRRFTQILSLPTWLATAENLRSRFGWPIVYDCHDLISGFRGISRDIVAAESRTFAQADHVFFSSKRLFDLHTSGSPALKNKSTILRNAVDPGHFAGAAEQRLRRAPTSPGVIGYFGALDEWFDIDALRQCLRRFPERKFQLIGRVEWDAIRSLASFPNLELVGEVAYERLPDFIAGFDVALIPFRVNALTSATNPIKLYEYFSAGAPVVSSRLSEVECFEDLVYVAENSEAFPECVSRALDETDPEKVRRRREVAAMETWSRRGSELAEVLSACFANACVHEER
jgi:glycosyltransferase involved in cell wall biosynthesis